MKLAVIYLTFLALCLCERAYAPAPPGPGYVYIKAETVNGQGTGYFKVGGTGTDRTTGRNTDNWRPIKAVYYFPVTMTRKAEKEAHKALKKWNVREEGGGIEWYHIPEDEAEDFVATLDNAIKKYLRTKA